ncbi:MAG: AAA family ATPase [Candidatus Micrarchaeota archaeon]|nr:AAA family ATPase [Candidatus Micrarchaeota archaeon]
MITSIELHNWKTHKDTKLDFAKGTNVLVGMMGAGKSSIMDAISYGLFGTFPAVQNRRVAIKDLITSRPVQESEASVRINFTLDGNQYSVLRSISGREGARATLEKNGAYLQSQPQRVSEEIERVLKVDYDLFSRAIYSEQNRLDYFLELRATDRKKQIDELLGLDKFARAQENATSLINKIKDTIKEHEKLVVAFDSAKASREINELSGELDAIRAKRKQLESDYVSIKKETSSVDAELKTAKESLTRKMGLAKEAAEIRSKLELIGTEMKKLGALKLPTKEELEREVSETNKKLSEIKESEQHSIENERRSSRSLSEVEAAIKLIRQRVVERDRIQSEQKDMKIEAVEKELDGLNASMHDAEKRLATNQAQREETAKWIKELDRHLSKCPVCERELDEQMKGRLMEAKKSALSGAELAIKEAESEARAKRSEVEKLIKIIDKLRLGNARLKEYVGLDEQLRESEAKISTTKESYEKAKAQSESVRKERDALSASLSEISSRKEKRERLDSYSRQSVELEGRLVAKSKEADAISIDEGRVELIQKKFTDLSAKSSALSSEIDAHARYASDKQKLIDEKNEQLARINKIAGEINERKAAADNLAKFKNALDETQRVLRNKLVGSINDVMQGIWPEIYPYGDYTAIMLEATADDYILKVRTSNGRQEKWEELEGIASGGERSIGCLAMRVAFALVLVPNLRWMILDEPTHNIDEQGLSRFVRVFNETLPRIIDQIFIITHDEALKHASSSRTYVLTRNKAEGGATAILEQ